MEHKAKRKTDGRLGCKLLERYFYIVGGFQIDDVKPASRNSTKTLNLRMPTKAYAKILDNWRIRIKEKIKKMKKEEDEKEEEKRREKKKLEAQEVFFMSAWYYSVNVSTRIVVRKCKY
ncbi:jg2067 [Pararge aegeria aegeria]|uniref:Jg2067 protein n=1 Tax=Pararge aegeria aegeria TaxID=348720 RepID=A0A8S4RHS8_9NEOP|nr:jg2067 [Pararge aegeria aegeria]